MRHITDIFLARLIRGTITYLGFCLSCVVVLAACTSATPQTGGSPSSTHEEVSAQTPVLLDEIFGNEDTRARTVVWEISSGWVDNPEQWNPLARDARLDKGLHQAMIEPLFVLNYESGVIEPWLAERMTPNSDQDVWVLRLREGVTWSDGEPFTADDVVFSVELLLANPDLELDFFAGMVGWIERVEKVDDLTVQFYLTGPNPRFQLDYFSVKVWGSFPILPEHIWRGQDPHTFTNYDPQQGWPVFTGPYVLEQLDADANVFEYVRNDDWWGAQTGFRPLPQPERLIWASLQIGGTEYAPDVANNVDSLGNLPLDIFLTVQENNPRLIAWLDGLPYAWMDPCSRTLSFNTQLEPWNTSDMRWAVNFAIDREQIVQEAYGSTTIPSRHFFPAYPALDRYVQLLEAAGLYERYPLTRHDPAESRRLIEAAGWVQDSDGYYTKDGQTLSLDIMAHEASETMRASAELIGEQLDEVGIRVTTRAMPNSDWVLAKSTGDFDAMIDWDSCGSVNEPWASLDRYHARWVRPQAEPVTNYNNQVRWSNQRYSNLVDEMAPLPLGDPRVDELFVDAMGIWLEELPFIPLVQEKQLVAFNTTYWVGWPTADNSYIHPPSWWQSAHVIIHNLEPVQPD